MDNVAEKVTVKSNLAIRRECEKYNPRGASNQAVSLASGAVLLDFVNAQNISGYCELDIKMLRKTLPKLH